MNENLILNSAAARQRIKELLGIDVEVELRYLSKLAANTPQECSIIGATERFCQPVWKFITPNGEKKYLNAIDGDINTDSHYFLREYEIHSGYSFQKGEVTVSAVQGWKNEFGLFLIEGAVRNSIKKIYKK